MKTADELSTFIQNCRGELSAESIGRLLIIADELNDRCQVLESRLAVAEDKLNAGGPAENPKHQPGLNADVKPAYPNGRF